MAASTVIMIGPVLHTREVEQLVTAFRESLREFGDAGSHSPDVIYRGFTRDLPTKPELVVNLAVARSLGVTIPASVLARANRRLD